MVKSEEPGRPPDRHLAAARGWLDDDDPFFAALEQVVARRRGVGPAGSANDASQAQRPEGGP